MPNQSSFEFLRTYNPYWASLARAAEKNFWEDPETTLSKLRKLGEAVANAIAESIPLAIEPRDQFELLEELGRANCVDETILSRMHTLRRLGNSAVHPARDGTPQLPEDLREDALEALRSAHALCIWFCRTYYEATVEESHFQSPSPHRETVVDAEWAEEAHDSTDLVLRVDPADEQEKAISVPGNSLSDIPEVRLAQLSELALKVIQAIRGNPDELERLLLKVHSNITAARQPLLLGVLGEFRTGKSTLINALAGDALALTDVVETTPLPCLFRQASTRGAHLVFRDGRRQALSVDEVNETLSRHRDDKGWLSTLSHLEYSTTLAGLDGFEIWDTPGLGGSEENERVANEFIDRVTGVLWVLDATLLGKASIAGPLQGLKQTGKTVVAVLNQVDGLDGEPEIAKAIQYVKTSYPGLVAEVVPLSATEALHHVTHGEQDARLTQLRRALQSCILNNAERDRLHRIQRTIEAAIWAVSDCIEDYQRDLDDRLGFLQHTRDNLQTACRRLVDRVPELTAIETMVAFRAVEQTELAALERRFGSLADTVADLREMAQSLGVGSTQERSRVDWLRSAKARIDNPDAIREQWKVVADGLLKRLETEWAAASDEAIELSRSAIPDVAPADLSKTTSPFRGTDDDRLLDQAVKHGVYAGGLAAAGVGVAAAAGLIAWPVLLLAIPVGLLAGWKKYDDLTYQAEPSSAEAEKIFRSYVSRRRKDLADQVVSDMQPKVSALLDEAIYAMAQAHEKEVLGAVHEATVQHASRILRWVSQKLQEVCSDGSRRSYQNLWHELPVVVTPDQDGRLKFESLFGSVRLRLDIILPSLDMPLGSLLFHLPSSVSVRLITTCHEQDRANLTKEIARAFGTWGGERKVKIAVTSDGLRVPIKQSVFVTPDSALVATDNLRGLFHRVITLVSHQAGHLAAQREFAELWEGKSARYGKLRIHSV